MLNPQALYALFAPLADDVRIDEPLKRHTSWRIGGPADVLVAPRDLESLQACIACAYDAGIPYFILGRGSNLLIRDGGIRGLVIKLGDAFSELRIEGQTLTALAGRSIVSAANRSMREGLSGLEFATGIPGSVGGAVTMNAGSHGGEIKDVLKDALVLTREGALKHVSSQDLAFSYRHSAVPENAWTVVRATFSLRAGDVMEMRERTGAWSQRRRLTQPLSQPNCGSVFRNPPGDYSARLIEAAGLKNTRVGDAMISDVHANFIVNLGAATAEDVLELMSRAQEAIQTRFAVELIPEVRVVGEAKTQG